MGWCLLSAATRAVCSVVVANPAAPCFFWVAAALLEKYFIQVHQDHEQTEYKLRSARCTKTRIMIGDGKIEQTNRFDIVEQWRCDLIIELPRFLGEGQCINL